MASTLILYMGNPIVRNDQLGLIVGSQLASFYSTLPEVEVKEFGGSPLDLVSDIQGYDGLILIDSISTGNHQIGSVTVFAEGDILAGGGDVYLHGMNLSEALKLARRLKLPFPAKVHLIGIEAGVIYEFDESPSAELRTALPRITVEVRKIVSALISSHP